MQTYTARKNARRAARRHFGADAVEGRDFEIVQADDGRFGVEPGPAYDSGESTDAPEPGKTYALTGGPNDARLSNGNSWAESEVAPSPADQGIAAAGGGTPADQGAAAAADESANQRRPNRSPGNVYTGKYARQYEEALEGKLPDPPDFSASSHARYRKRLETLKQLAADGDLEGLRAEHINPVSSSPKALMRYRDIAIVALEARRQQAPERPGDAAARYAEENGVSYDRALVACNMD